MMDLFFENLYFLMSQNSKTNTKTNTIKSPKPYQNQYLKTKSFGFGTCLGGWVWVLISAKKTPICTPHPTTLFCEERTKSSNGKTIKGEHYC
jgi:hypothetical protein